MRPPTKIEESNEQLAETIGFYLWNSGGNIMGYAKEVGGIHVFVGSAGSSENFEDTTAEMKVWGFDIQDESGYLLEDPPADRKDSDLKTALLDADYAIQEALGKKAGKEQIFAVNHNGYLEYLGRFEDEAEARDELENDYITFLNEDTAEDFYRTLSNTLDPEIKAKYKS